MNQGNQPDTLQLSPEAQERYRKRLEEASRRHIQLFSTLVTKLDHLNPEDRITLSEKLSNIKIAIEKAFHLGHWEVCVFALTDLKLEVNYKDTDIKSSALFEFLTSTGQWNEAIELLNLALESSIKLNLPLLTAGFHRQLTDIYYNQSEYNLAAKQNSAARDILMKEKVIAGIIATLITDSDIHWRFGFYDSSLENLEMARDLAQKADEQIMLRLVNERIDEYNRLIKKSPLSEQEESLKIKLAEVEEQKNTEELAVILYNLGTLYLENENLVEAEIFLKRAYDTVFELAFPIAADIYLALGRLYFLKEEKELAYKHFIKCVELFEILGKKEGEAESYNLLAQLLNSIGKYEIAYNLATKSLELYIETGYALNIANVLSWIGRILANLSDLEDATKYFIDAAGLYGSLNDLESQAYIQIELGRIYIKLNKLKEAEEIGQVAYDNFANLNDTDGLIEALGIQRYVAYENSDYIKAKSIVLKMLSLVESLNNIDLIAISHSRLGFIHEQLGETDASKASFLKSHEIFNSYDSEYTTFKAFTEQQLGIIYYKEEKYTESLEYLNAALELCKKINALDIHASALYHKGKVVNAMGDSIHALEYLNQALKVAESEKFPLAESIKKAIDELKK